jgi:hypothetical protein
LYSFSHLCRRLSAVLKGFETSPICGRIPIYFLPVKGSKKIEKALSISRVLFPPFYRREMTIYLGPALLQASVGLPGEVSALRRHRNGPSPLVLFTLFSLSSRRDCRVSLLLHTVLIGGVSQELALYR